MYTFIILVHVYMYNQSIVRADLKVVIYMSTYATGTRNSVGIRKSQCSD